MPDIKLQRIPFTPDADNRLRMMRARTGITPNILGRIGFCLSLDEPGIPTSIAKDTKVGREINRFTMLGEYDVAYIALLVTRIRKDGLSNEALEDQFVAHMNRGVELLAARVKTLADLPAIVG